MTYDGANQWTRQCNTDSRTTCTQGALTQEHSLLLSGCTLKCMMSMVKENTELRTQQMRIGRRTVGQRSCMNYHGCHCQCNPNNYTQLLRSNACHWQRANQLFLTSRFHKTLIWIAGYTVPHNGEDVLSDKGTEV